jgi:hypothetical protein
MAKVFTEAIAKSTMVLVQDILPFFTVGPKNSSISRTCSSTAERIASR